MIWILNWIIFITFKITLNFEIVFKKLKFFFKNNQFIIFIFIEYIVQFNIKFLITF